MTRALVTLVALSLFVHPAAAQQLGFAQYDSVHHPEYSRTGMVSAQSRLAAEIGAAVLADGGNAVDAAIATGFAMAVTLPRAGNIGGGGFMLVYDAESGESVAIDFRETAPLRAYRDMFLDDEGNVDSNAVRHSHLSVGVPGTVAGFHEAHQRYGRLPWQRLVEPAIALARNGIAVPKDLADRLLQQKDRLCRFEAACDYFFKADGSAYEMGEQLVQDDLAATLQLIADLGRDGFYKGTVADLIAAEMARHGGLVDHESLEAYKPVIREPIRGTYRGYDIVAMPPSSSGGIHVIQMLNVLEHFSVAEMGAGSADSIHLLAETMRLAFADRSEHLGDIDFYDVPIDWLISKAYAEELAARIDMTRATSSSEVKPGVPPPPESPETSHLSVADADGNVVSMTYTLNLTYGSAIAVEGAGFLLNDEMDDFVAKPGTPNAYGLIGDEANAVEPGKRPLSSMTPVIVLRDGEPWFATGSPGGSRIISAVLQLMVNMIDHGMNIADATHAPLMHHQWWPDRLNLEISVSPDTVKLLRERGHDVLLFRSLTSSLQSVAIEDGWFQGAADPRRPGAGSVAPVSIDD